MTFKVVTSILNFYIPTVIITVLYVRIFLAIKRRSQDIVKFGAYTASGNVKLLCERGGAAQSLKDDFDEWLCETSPWKIFSERVAGMFWKRVFHSIITNWKYFSADKTALYFHRSRDDCERSSLNQLKQYILFCCAILVMLQDVPCQLI